MPNINLRDHRGRDALVRAEPVKQVEAVRYIDAEGGGARLHKVLKATIEHDHAALLKAHEDDPDKLAAALVAGDPDVDVERVGTFLNRPARVWVNDAQQIVYRILETEIVHNPDGSEKERRARVLREPNIESEFPISWTGRKILKADAIRRFVFSSKLQIVHANGLTYDFLYGMAKELAEAESLMLLGAGKTGKEPLVFRRGGAQYRGFVEGRIDGARYVLLLHLSSLELKMPAPVEAVESMVAIAAATADEASAEQQPLAATTGSDGDKAATKPGKPSAKDVLDALQPKAAAGGAKVEIKDTVSAARSAKRRTSAAATSAPAGERSGGRSAKAGAKEPRKAKAKSIKPASKQPDA